MSKSEDRRKSSSWALQASGCFLLGLPASLTRPCLYGGHPLLRVQSSAFTLRAQRPTGNGATPILLSSPLLSGTTVSHLQTSNSPLCPVNQLQLSRLISKHPTFLDLLGLQPPSVGWPWHSPCFCVSRSVSDSLRPWGLYSPPGPRVHGILQTRTLEWVAIPFSRDLPTPRQWP